MTLKLEKSGGKARFIENDQEFLVADEGNVGIGTDTPAQKLHVAGTVRSDAYEAIAAENGTAMQLVSQAGAQPGGNFILRFDGPNTVFETPQSRTFSFVNNSIETMRLTPDGNVGIGTANPAAKLGVSGDIRVTDAVTVGANDPDTGSGASLVLGTLLNEQLAEVGSLREGGSFSSAITFSTNEGPAASLGERARITGAGYFKSDPSGSYTDNAGNEKLGTVHFIKHNGANGEGLILAKTDATNSSPTLVLSQANNTDGFIIQAKIGTGLLEENVFLVAADGDVVNTNNSYGAISDIKLKENITDSTPKLDDIAAIRFVNYNLKSQPETKQFGVIAQELEEIFPALVETTPDVDSEGNETGESTKSVKYSVLTLMAVKALQEANDKITALEERLAALEAGN